ncbi:MAG: hypothetical protein ACP5QS_07405, partial [bacterium]
MKLLSKSVSQFAFLLLSISLLSMGSIKPQRVALISSSGVNNDFRSWGEYDGILKELGWQYDKFRNTQITSFFSKSKDYDLLLTTSLWNYGDPQDMVALIPQWKGYLEAGGIVILTDMAYPPMCDWLSSLDPGLFIQYGDARKEIGDLSLLDTSSPSPFLSNPNPVGSFPYWAHFSKWGKNYQVWARTKGGTAVGLYAPIGSGIFIVTTGFALPPKMLENLYVNALRLKNGFDVQWKNAPRIIAPGKFEAELSVRNLRDKRIGIEVSYLIMDAETGEVVSKSDDNLIELAPSEEKLIRISLDCSKRGDFLAVARCRTEGMTTSLDYIHNFRVPPLVELSLNRAFFAHFDILKAKINITPFEEEKATVNLYVKDDSQKIYWEKSLTVKGEHIVEIPLKSLPVGSFTLIANVKTKSEQGEAKEGFIIEKINKPKTITKIGRKGEMLINGEFFFPLGTYHIGVEDFKKAKEIGFNCITSPIYGAEQKRLTPEQLQWHDSAFKEGLWVITELSEYIRGGRKNFEEAKSLVSQLRLHPATIVHYVIDEPMGGGISPEKVNEFCQLVKEVDPDHITFVNEVPGEVVKYAGIGDVTGTDPYPIGAGVPDSLAWVGEAVESAVQASKGKPVWGVIQAHRQPPANSRNRFPTPEELRCMSY